MIEKQSKQIFDKVNMEEKMKEAQITLRARVCKNHRGIKGQCKWETGRRKEGGKMGTSEDFVGEKYQRGYYRTKDKQAANKIIK